METKAIFLDVDGTLVSFNTHRVPQSAVDALREVHRAGIKIIIATGRPYTDLHEIKEIPYDAIAALNGADCVLRDGTSIARHPIGKDDFLQVQALANHYGFPLAIETDRGILINEINPTVVELANLVDHPVPPVVDIEKEFAKEACSNIPIRSATPLFPFPGEGETAKNKLNAESTGNIKTKKETEVSPRSSNFVAVI